MRSVVEGLPNRKIERPDARSAGVDPARDIRELFERFHTPSAVRDLYEKLEPQILALGEGLWRKVSPTNVTFYSSRRVFVYLEPRVSGLRLLLFTRGEPIPGVTPMGYQSGGFKWGRIWARGPADIPGVVEACRESYVRIVQAVEANEPTGW